MRALPARLSRPVGGGWVLSVLFLVLSLVYVLLFFTARPEPSPAIFLFDFIYLVIFPGCVLAGFLVDPRRLALTAVVSLTLGAALFYVVLVLSVFLPFGAAAAAWLIPILTAFAVAARAVASRRDGDQEQELIGAEPGGARTSLILVLLLAACAALILSVGDPLLYTSDSADHIAYIRAVAREGEAFPERFLYAEGGRLTADIRKGLAHSMWGTLNAIRGNLEIVPLWKYISLVTTLWILGALYLAGVMLTRRPAIGLVAVILFVLFYHGGLCGYQLILNAYGFPSGRFHYLVFISMLPLLAGDKRRRPLAVAAAAAFCAVGNHVMHALLIGFIVALAAVFFTLSAPRGKRITAGAAPWIRAAFWIALACAPYLALRYINHYHPNNLIHQEDQGLLAIRPWLITGHPAKFFDSAGALFLLATAAVFFLWGYARDRRMLRMLLWGVIGILAVIFNPLTAPFAIEKLIYLVYRLEFAVPSMLVAAWFLAVLWDWTFADASRRRGRAAAGSIVAALILIPRLVLTPAGFAYGGEKLRDARRRSSLNAADLFTAVQSSVPPGGVVASDPVTSYSIPAFTDRFVVCTYDQHSVPNDSTATERIIACRDVFSPAVSLAEAGALLERYGAEYVAVNARLPRGLPAMFWKPPPGSARATARRLLRAEEVFEPVWQGEDAWLLRYLGTGELSAEADSVLPAPPAPPPGAPRPAPIPSGVEHVSIAAVETPADTVTRGRRLDLAVDWIRTGPVSAGGYISYVRFDTPFPTGPLYSEHYGKLYRKLIESARNERFRFRHDRFPFGGTHPPDRWPLGFAVRDVFMIEVPADIAPGKYTISIKLVRATRSPNLDLADYLRNEDFFSGRAVGTIMIR